MSGSVEYIDQQVTFIDQTGSKDIILFSQDKLNPNLATFSVQLENNDKIVVNIIDKFSEDFWQKPNFFPILLTQDTSDISKYCFIEYVSNQSINTYVSNILFKIPKRRDLDAFEIYYYDEENEKLQCRFNKVQLHNLIDPEKSIQINGSLIVSTIQ